MSVELITIERVLAAYDLNLQDLVDAPVGATYVSGDAEITTDATLRTDGVAVVSIKLRRSKR